VAAQDEGVDIVHRDVEFHRDEGAEAGGVEDAGHADHPVLRKAAHIVGDVAHRIQGVADDDQDGVGGILRHLLGHLGHDPLVGGQQVIPAHPRLSRNAGRDDNNVGIPRLFVAIGSDEVGVVLLHRRRLRQIEGLPLRNPLDDIHQDHIAKGLFAQTLRSSCSDVSRTDHGHLLVHRIASFSLSFLRFLVQIKCMYYISFASFGR
jgi:hypothetical protein